jgi:hypothetical protein
MAKADEFLERLQSWRKRFEFDFKKSWWWVLLIGPIVGFGWDLIMHRVLYSTNKYIDDHVSLAFLKPAMMSLVGSPLIGPVFVGFLVFLLAVFGLVVLAYYETRHRSSRALRAQFTNARVFPDIRKATMIDVLESEKKAPGWEKRAIGWEWFMEVHVVNGSRPITIEDIKVEVKLDSEILPSHMLDDLDDYLIDTAMDENANYHSFSGGQRYRPVDSLKGKLYAVPLAEGVGYRGWVHVDLGMMVGQGDIGRAHLDMWLIDAFGTKHEVDFSKDDEKNWDKSFLIFRNVKPSKQEPW